ncbi:SDR family oxidoreductase [Rubellimicrobium aerolatum]|uniref:SDR family oxidoreductase n=1 Tax=Rubellimicrobium aerolatum TaxID=490979 RepID=A0ABW0S923_9RHOB|nr:SDR family oxidoreductase [Rubellimicrobium aerolatum]MBP1804806.1 glucose 1-dehydrogenase [Rubellimicrobium aerolatum]
MLDLTGKVAIVTGSDSGIGRATALAFAQAGADVAVTFHADAQGGEDTAARVRAEGRRALLKQLDVTDEDAVQTLFDAVESDLGLPDILVNNAGTGGDAEVADMDTATWDRVIRTDLYGPFFCCRAFIRARKRAGAQGGKIVNVTSVHEAIPTPGGAAYGAAKGGLLTFTRSLALELAPLRINVNAVAPGLIRTPMTAERTEDPEAMKEELPRIPWNRPGEPEEVARLALYLAAPDSDYVTGQSFTIDGGLEMNWGQGA